MIIVALIALLAALAVPQVNRARKRAQATEMYTDLRMLDAALSQYCVESNKGSGASFTWTDLRPYLKVGTRLYNVTSATGSSDLLGNSYGTTGVVDGTGPGFDPLHLSRRTYDRISDVIPLEFWSPYGVGP